MDRLNGTGYLEAILAEKKNEEGKLIAKYNIKALKEGRFMLQFGDNLEAEIETLELYNETDRELELEVGEYYDGEMYLHVDDSFADVAIKSFNDSGFLCAAYGVWGKGAKWQKGFSLVPLREGECTIDLGYGNSWHIVAKNKSGIKIQKMEVTGEDGFHADMDDDRLILTKGKKYAFYIEATGDIENSNLFSRLNYAENFVKKADRRPEDGTHFITAEFIGDTVGYYGLCKAFGSK